MIQTGRATFVVLSRKTQPDEVTRVLGLHPSGVGPGGGSSLRSGRAQEHHVWRLEAEEQHNAADDESGTLALRTLLDLCRTAVGRVTKLPADCEPRIWWSAYSDSEQAGFVLPAELAEDIAQLGVDVFATVHIKEPAVFRFTQSHLGGEDNLSVGMEPT